MQKGDQSFPAPFAAEMRLDMLRLAAGSSLVITDMRPMRHEAEKLLRRNNVNLGSAGDRGCRYTVRLIRCGVGGQVSDSGIFQWFPLPYSSAGHRCHLLRAPRPVVLGEAPSPKLPVPLRRRPVPVSSTAGAGAGAGWSRARTVSLTLPSGIRIEISGSSPDNASNLSETFQA